MNDSGGDCYLVSGCAIARPCEGGAHVQRCWQNDPPPRVLVICPILEMPIYPPNIRVCLDRMKSPLLSIGINILRPFNSHEHNTHPHHDDSTHLNSYRPHYHGAEPPSKAVEQAQERREALDDLYRYPICPTCPDHRLDRSGWCYHRLRAW